VSEDCVRNGPVLIRLELRFLINSGHNSKHKLPFNIVLRRGWNSFGMLAACCWSMLKKIALQMRLAEMLLALKMRTE
jgi:hypothetical protein